jgi:O-acetyl-ADP-ribose deacetylase (regulator of RNase III)
LDVWERVADTRSRQSRQQNAVEEQEAYSRLPREGGRLPARSIRATAHALDVWRRPRPLSYTNEFLYDVNYPVEHPMRIGIVTGDLRRVRCAEVWVNSENTNMRMSRFEEFSISAIIRFEGALRDEVGRVIHDCIADELSRKIAGRSPVAPGTAVTTGSGQLAKSNGVHYVIHVAAVHGEPGEGYHQILDVGRCVTNALAEMERRLSSAVRSILFPLLGTGVGGAELEPTVSAMLGAALDHLATKQSVKTRTIYFLAYTDIELEVCRNLFDRSSRLSRSAVS